MPLPSPSLTLCPRRPDLTDVATARASKHHGAAPVVIGGHSSQAIVLVHEQGCALNGDCASQGLVEVLPTEVIIDLQGLQETQGERRAVNTFSRAQATPAIRESWRRQAQEGLSERAHGQESQDRPHNSRAQAFLGSLQRRKKR